MPHQAPHPQWPDASDAELRVVLAELGREHVDAVPGRQECAPPQEVCLEVLIQSDTVVRVVRVAK